MFEGERKRREGAKKDGKEELSEEDLSDRTSRTVSGLSRNNTAFNNGCLVPSGERCDGGGDGGGGSRRYSKAGRRTETNRGEVKRAETEK